MLKLLSDESDATGVTVAEATFRKLLQLITVGEISPGSDVGEEEFAAKLTVSRTPLRDAIRRLEAIGFVVRRNNRTLFVPPLSVDEMRDLSIAREALETAVVREVAQRAREKQISFEALDEVHARIKTFAKIGNSRLLLDAGLEFHRELYRLAGLPTVTALLTQILLRIERYRRLTEGDLKRNKLVAVEHEVLIDALKRGDEDASEKAIREHLRAARAIYIAKIRSKTRQ
jgi:DNA-binding GntR family transcriptional regulator